MFHDRTEAAFRLTQVLKKHQGESAVILAVPRGGVPIAKVIADALDMPLDVSLIKKIGHPENKEYAIGAVSLDHTFLRKSEGHIPREYIDNEVSHLRHELRRKYQQYRGNRDPVRLQGKTVIIVDDGIATGSTLMATIRQVRALQAAYVIIAAPVGPPSAVRKLQEVADEVICLEMPSDFRAVGQFYENFDEVKDEEVIDMLHDVNAK